MPITQLGTRQIKDGGVTKQDMDTTTPGSAVITRVVAGSGVSLDSTGPDAGTGEVTINVTGGSSGLPNGGTTGQALRKNSENNGDATWQNVNEVPNGGTTGQVLRKSSNGNQALSWGNIEDIKFLSITSPANLSLASVAYGNGVFVAVHDSDLSSDSISYSNDGINWKIAVLPANNRFVSVAFGNGLFVAVSSNNNTSEYLTIVSVWKS
jgi:hypothetical protein